MRKATTHSRISIETKQILVKLRRDPKFKNLKEDDLIQYALMRAFKKR